jgi:hypothetical protein
VDKVISTEEIEEIKSLIGTNFYEVTSDGLANARNLLAEIYKLEDIKTSL